MAFNNNTPRLEFTATSGQTEFVFNFKVFNTSDIVVYQTPTGQTPDDATDILIEATDYTVVIDGDNGGTVTLVSGATLNDSITLLRNLPFTRETDYQTGGDLLEAVLDEDQDYQTYLSQQLEASKDRFLNIPASVQGVSATLPAPAPDAYFKWDSAGTAIENDTTIPDAVTTSAANAAAALASATQAQLYEWEAEAERLTADSYATEAEDTFVNIVTSNGDGTFTYTPTTEYSALHYKNKAQASAASVDLNLLSPRAITITPPTDADYTLTATENGYGRLVLVDGSWLSGHNIIVDNTERSFLVDNSAGTYTATVKTSAGTGIPVLAGTKVWLLCDGTNVIESVDSASLDGLLNANSLLHIQHQEPSGTNAGSYASGVFSTRKLNAVVTNNIAGASLASNTITLPAGEYYIEAYANAVGDNGNTQKTKVKIRNTTTSSDILIGSSEYVLVVGTGAIQGIKTVVNGKITLASISDIQLMQWFTYSASYSGGIPVTTGLTEVYAEIKIWKVA